MPHEPLSPRERRRNARALERRMVELDRLDALHGLGALPGSRPPPRRQSHITAGTLAITAVLLAAVVLLIPSVQMESIRRALGLGSERVLPPPQVGKGRGPYAFTMAQQGGKGPVGWDPCRSIRYQVNVAGQPPGGDQLIRRAIDRASEATGLAFEDQGSTEQRPFTDRFVPLGTDQPVVIGWGTATEFPQLAGDVAGIGGAASERGVRGRTYYVTGAIALDTAAFTEESIANAPQVMEAIALHEIAHVIGLDHVNEPMELMAATNSGQIDFGPGDREGLARLGSIPCA